MCPEKKSTADFQQQLGMFFLGDPRPGHREEEQFRCRVVLFYFFSYLDAMGRQCRERRAEGSHGREIPSGLSHSFPVCVCCRSSRLLGSMSSFVASTGPFPQQNHSRASAFGPALPLEQEKCSSCISTVQKSGDLVADKLGGGGRLQINKSKTNLLR